MKPIAALAFCLLAMAMSPMPVRADEPERSLDRDILVTFENSRAGAARSGIGAPYRYRKRYAVSAIVRRNAAAVADDYTLEEVDSWPISALGVYCVVYRIDAADDRRELIDRLNADRRVESAQPLQEFETSADSGSVYDDTYINLQHGFSAMSVSAAHRHSLGEGVRITIIDSEADTEHEDLRGRLRRVQHFSANGTTADTHHGTAIASVIGASANNARGIVGVAPEAQIELFAACWAEEGSDSAVCDSFSLARALDAAIAESPDIVNLSLTGPFDSLLARLLRVLHENGVILVSAVAADLHSGNEFPASLDGVIGVSSSAHGPTQASTDARVAAAGNFGVFAPGDRILVAVPDDRYDFRSGSSIAAAHISGVVALLLAGSPHLEFGDVRDLLIRSQTSNLSDTFSVNACAALQLVDSSRDCR